MLRIPVISLLNIKKVLLFFLFFFYIYTVSFVFAPLGIHTRMLMGLVGMLLCFQLNFEPSHSFSWKADRFIYPLILLSLFISFISLLSLVYNGTSDYVYVSFPVSTLLVFFSGYFIVHFSRKVWKIVSFELLANYIVGVVSFQMLLSLLFFIFPEVREQFDSIITFDSLQEEALLLTDGMRLHGFGINFFEGGVVNSSALVLTAALMKNAKQKKHLILYFGAFLWILIIGSMMSRTTLIGGIIGFGLLIYKSHIFSFSLSFRVLTICKSLVIFSVILGSVFFLLPQGTLDEFETIFNFGFELVVNFFEYGEFRSASTDDLLTAYIVPDNLKTLLLGDGLYADPSAPDSAYYMGTDVGFLRLIFYFGLLGLFFFFLFYAYCCYVGYKKNFEYKTFFLFFFLLIVALNLKGTINLFYIILLFDLTDYYKEKNRIETVYYPENEENSFFCN